MLGSRCWRQNKKGVKVRNLPLPRSQKMQLSIGRGSRIRTCGPLLPKQVLYQAELCPDTGRAVFSSTFLPTGKRTPPEQMDDADMVVPE